MYKDVPFSFWVASQWQFCTFFSESLGLERTVFCLRSTHLCYYRLVRMQQREQKEQYVNSIPRDTVFHTFTFLRKITVQYESHPLILTRDWRMHFHTKKTVHLYIHCDFLIAKIFYIYFQSFFLFFFIPSNQNNKLIFHRPKNSSINLYIKTSKFCSSLKPF